MPAPTTSSPSTAYAQSEHRRTTFGTGLLKGLGITFRHLVSPSVTIQYPDEIDQPPARSRGVIALKIENCTVCMLCARECPDWCIYIEGHKQERAAKGEGKRAKKYNVLDRFAIDYALCMYCGICVEVCPYDALFWSPEFEYADTSVVELTHEKEKLETWMYTVLPPDELDPGALGPEVKAAPAASAATQVSPAPPAAEGAAPAPATPPAPPAAPAQEPKPVASSKPALDPVKVHDAVLKDELEHGTEARLAEVIAASDAARVIEEAAAGAPLEGGGMENQEQSGKAGTDGAAAAPPAAAEPSEAAPPSAAPEPAPAAGVSAEEAAQIRAKVLDEENAKGSDPRVAQARAKSAEMRALKGTKGPQG